MAKIMFHLNCLELGGAERVVTNLSAQFAKDGYDVIVATEWQGEEEYELYDKVKRMHAGLRPEDENNSRIVKYFKRIHYLKKLIKEEKPDVVIAFAKKANYRALMATLHIDVPVIIAVRANPLGVYNGRADKFFISWLFKKAAGGVFQTYDQRDYFKDTIGTKCIIILNPINEKYVGRENVAARTKDIIHAGRLVAFKNQKMLLHAFASVHKSYPAYNLRLFGGDSYDGTKEELETIIRTYRLEDSIFIMGNSTELEKDMESGAFFVMTSNEEGLPNALMEAMALGLPVISTDCPCGGPATIIQEKENGMLFPVGDQNALEKAMLYMIENKDKAENMGKEAKKLSQKANAHTVYIQWKDYVEGILKQ